MKLLILVPKLVSFADKFCKINAREKLKNNIINNLSKTSIKLINKKHQMSVKVYGNVKIN